MWLCSPGEESFGFFCKLLWKVNAHKGFLLPSCCTEWLTPNGYFCNSSFFATSKHRGALLTHTHTQRRVRLKTSSRFFLEWGPKQGCFRPLAELEPDCVTAALVTGNPKLQMEPTQNLVQCLILLGVLAATDWLQITGVRKKSDETSNLQCSPLQQRFPKNCLNMVQRMAHLTSALASFSQPGFCLLLQCMSWLLHLSPPQHLFQNNSLPLSPASFQSLLGWGRGLRLLRGLAAITVPQLVK